MSHCESCAALQRELDAERARAEESFETSHTALAERAEMMLARDQAIARAEAAESRAATAERELDGVRTYARNQASLPYFMPGGRDAGEHWQEALNEIASPVMRWSPPPEPATCATCEGYGYVNPGLHEKDCPDCTTQPASVADGGKEAK